jgi:hypothetical protein
MSDIVPDPIPGTCGACSWWDPNSETDWANGRCRYNPPDVLQAAPQPLGWPAGLGAWPTCTFWDWCAMYVELTGPRPPKPPVRKGT